MNDDDQQNRDDTNYSIGHRQAWLSMLSTCLRELGYHDTAAAGARWVAEREAAVLALRSLCGEFGDNDWPEDLRLGDVISKHLGDHLRS